MCFYIHWIGDNFPRKIFAVIKYIREREREKERERERERDYDIVNSTVLFLLLLLQFLPFSNPSSFIAMYKNKTYLYYILAYVRCQYDVKTPVYFKSNSRGFSSKTESTRINCRFTTQVWYDIKKEKIYRVYNQMPAAYISLYLSTSDGSRGDPARCILWGWGGVNPRGTLSPQSYWPRAPRTDVGTTNNDVKQTRAFWRWRVRPFFMEIWLRKVATSFV